MANDQIGDGSECVSHRCDIVSSFNIQIVLFNLEAN